MAEEIDVEEGGVRHSTRGPSSAKRWSNCVGSPNLIAKLGDKARKSGIEAAEGSAAHALLATCLRGGEDAWEHQGQKIKIEQYEFTVNQEMIDGVQLAIDFVRDKMAKFRDKGAILLVEQGVASPEDEDAFGTADIIIIVPRERIIVPDFKYGKGVTVEADDEQVRLYGQYAFETFYQFKDIGITDPDIAGLAIFPDDNTVCELFIIQPRAIHEKGPIRRHVTSKSELRRFFFGEMLPALKDSKKPDAPLKMGEWCTWCPASDFCPCLQKGVKEYNVGVEPSALSDQELNDVLVKGEQIIKQHERNKKEVFARMMAGKHTAFADWKLVRQIAKRVWKPGTEEQVSMLGPVAYTDPVLKSPAQIEDLSVSVELMVVDQQGNQVLDEKTGKPLTITKTAQDIVAEFAMKPETGLTVAPKNDRREAQRNAMAAFDKAVGNKEEKAA